MLIEEIKAHCQDADSRLARLYDFLKIDDYKKKMADIEATMSRNDFWDDKEKAQETVQQLSACKAATEPFYKLKAVVDDFHATAELAEEDESFLTEADGAWADLSEQLDKLELVSFLSGKFDRNNCFFFIHAGAGGTESCDWASILMRMYRRWFERRGFKDEVIDMQPGDEAGIKSVTLRVEGEFAYGYLKAERGIHRLVRISPFDSNARRHTSFASADAFPELSEDLDIEIDEKDLKIDTYRASGAGGQYVNRTDSAVRITHLPTGIVVSCQMERSQHKNRAMCYRMLQARLYEKAEEERRKEAAAITGEKSDIAWGNQIRSYVLQPYQLIKDLRTDYETGNVNAVLDGDLDPFVEAYLRMNKN
ncbi:MAG: peptide chain release factor 2 [Lentisphaeria bacterium]|nr:peptide chain release factor 2 [Lentisphaeria bacterium]